MDFIEVKYYETPDSEKVAGTLVVRPENITVAFSVPGYRNRTVIFVESGLKFCVKGKPGYFLGAKEPATKVLNE